jgi:WS/DGAT/MGAT family acyltransferase
MGRYRMANADAAWLHMDRPGNLMTVNSVLWFDDPVAWDALRGVLQERLVDRYPRFRQRVVEGGFPRGGVFWEDVDDFELDDHLHRVTLDPPGDRAALERFASAQMRVPFDRGRPLWRVFLIDGYGAGCAVMTQMHHCIADGIALSRVLLSLTDERPDGRETGVADVTDTHEGHGLVSLDTVRTVVGGLAHQELDLITHPSHLMGLAAGLADQAKALAKLVLTPPDAHTRLRRGTSGEKRAVWTAPLSLDTVKQAAHEHGGTVNDVLLAAVSGALREYLHHHEELAHDVRAIVPFNLRALDRPLPRELGNKFGLVFLRLPVATDTAIERMRAMRARMQAIKHSPEGQVAYGLLNGIGLTPVQLEKLIVDFFTSKGTAVMTNVAGPRRQIYLAGTPLRGVIPWVPCSGNIGIGLSIFSYNDQVVLGLTTDTRAVPDPERILDLFRAELDKLATWTTRHEALTAV